MPRCPGAQVPCGMRDLPCCSSSAPTGSKGSRPQSDVKQMTPPRHRSMVPISGLSLRIRGLQSSLLPTASTTCRTTYSISILGTNHTRLLLESHHCFWCLRPASPVQVRRTECDGKPARSCSNSLIAPDLHPTLQPFRISSRNGGNRGASCKCGLSSFNTCMQCTAAMYV